MREEEMGWVFCESFSGMFQVAIWGESKGLSSTLRWYCRMLSERSCDKPEWNGKWDRR